MGICVGNALLRTGIRAARVKVPGTFTLKSDKTYEEVMEFLGVVEEEQKQNRGFSRKKSGK
jgi:hypothetical protein